MRNVMGVASKVNGMDFFIKFKSTTLFKKNKKSIKIKNAILHVKNFSVSFISKSFCD